MQWVRRLRWVALVAGFAALTVGLAGCEKGDGERRTIRVDLSAIELGGFRADATPTLGEVIDSFGAPDGCDVLPETRFASATWRELGLRVVAGRLSPIPGGGDACESAADVFVSSVEITGEEWETSTGLKIGDPEGRASELYPYARRGPERLVEQAGWWLVVTVTQGARFRPAPALLAKASGGKVVMFVIQVGGEGL